MITKLNEICNCCDDDQQILQIFDDKCFKIVDGKETTGEFCLGDFAVPVDGYTCAHIAVELDGSEFILFDNKVGGLSPSGVLESGKLYARGILLKIIYPVNDSNGDEIEIYDKSVSISLENADTLIESIFPLYTFFSIFTNPKSNTTSDLINKIKIINPNLLYDIKISALVLFGKAK
jgi:hypothetical protein